MRLVDFHSLFYSAACSYTPITLSHSQETYLSNENNVLPFSSILVPIPFFPVTVKSALILQSAWQIQVL